MQMWQSHGALKTNPDRGIWRTGETPISVHSPEVHKSSAKLVFDTARYCAVLKTT